ncbi:hypothetical protein JIX56_46210 [Streptomyces sp. CA-210063]|nr:hypothetical protein [Streptomyces sp. CA-210063]UUU36619.1 hypothetical protein JIX56_46210 [Streptomyces sp. CA-210063]
MVRTHYAQLAAGFGVGITTVHRSVAEAIEVERQALVIARALHFGARVLILDEPTSALGVREAEIVLRAVETARDRGIGVVLITHQAHHALRVGDHFAVIAHGRLVASFARGEKEAAEVIDLMAGGAAMEELERGQA